MPEDELLDALRGLGADHEPDVAAIRRRMEDQRPKVVPLRRKVEQAPRKRPVLLSAVAALLVGGGVTVAASQLSPASNTTPASKMPVVVPSFDTPSDEATQSPTPSETDGKNKDATPDGAATSTSGSKGTTPADDSEATAGSGSNPSTSTKSKKNSGSTASQATLSAAALSSGQTFSLSDSQEDWLAIGSRNDLKTIQKKAALGSPLISFTAPDSAQSVDGPFKLSWTGGAPEQDRDGSTRWLQTDGAVLTVNASSAARTITLYTGNAMNVSVSGQDLKSKSTELGDSAPGYEVTVQIPSHSGETTITLQSGRGPVHLLAATASSS